MKLLFAEDDRDLSRALQALLERAGYSVDCVYTGDDALDYVKSDAYDGMILDWMLPGRDGLDVLRRLRAGGHDLPCLILTARDAVQDRVAGLDAGADDYLAKPFDTQELLARVRAMLRRRTSIRPDIASFEDLELDKAAMELRCGQKTSRLSAKAYQLMEMLIERPHTVLSVQQIMDHVWGWDSEAEINVVWVNISFLRKRILELGAHVEIRASRGLGYSLERKND
ncbi:MAG: response regulator transcription factor [Clostridiales bacterium]|nr:response regulator transcription factor [Clostridiales bacterium]